MYSVRTGFHLQVHRNTVDETGDFQSCKFIVSEFYTNISDEDLRREGSHVTCKSGSYLSTASPPPLPPPLN